MNHRAPAQVEQVLALPHVASPISLPVPYVRKGVLHLHPLPQLRPPLRRALALPELLQQPLVGVDGNAPAAPLALGAALPQGALGARLLGETHHPPGSKGISIPAGQRNDPRSQSISKAVLGKRSPLLTRHALQYTSSSGGRSLTSSLLRYARSTCNSLSSAPSWCSRSSAMAPVTEASGALASVTPTALTNSVSRSRRMWRL